MIDPHSQAAHAGRLIGALDHLGDVMIHIYHTEQLIAAVHDLRLSLASHTSLRDRYTSHPGWRFAARVEAAILAAIEAEVAELQKAQEVTP